MKKKKYEIKDRIRAAIYCRVSTYNQGQGSYSSLDSQEELLRGYAGTKDWDIYDVYIDTKTGTTLEREALTRLLKDAGENKFDIVLATKLDRISRSMKDFYNINEILANHDVDLALATQNIDTSSSMGRFNRNVLMAFAEFERDMIAERTREKLFSQAQNGSWGGGVATLGYNVIDKALVINEKEAELIKKIFESYLTTPSMSKIAKKLNDEGYITKQRQSKKKNSSGGGPFNKSHIHAILRNKRYIGKICYDGHEFDGIHEAIIDSITFDKVQKKIEASKKDHRMTYESSELLLLGLTKCGFCGSQLTTSFAVKDGQRYYYYKCTRTLHYDAGECESKAISAIELENFVVQVIFHLATDVPFFEAIVTQAYHNSRGDVELLEKGKKDKEINFKRINQELSNLIRILKQSDSMVNLDTFRYEMEKLEKQKKEIEQDLAKTIIQISEKKNLLIPKDDLRRIFNDFKNIFEQATFEEKRRLIHILLSEITLTVKKKEKTGMIKFVQRMGGEINKEWNEAKQSYPTTNPIEKGKKKNDNSGSSYRSGWLRG